VNKIRCYVCFVFSSIRVKIPLKFLICVSLLTILPVEFNAAEEVKWDKNVTSEFINKSIQPSLQPQVNFNSNLTQERPEQINFQATGRPLGLSSGKIPKSPKPKELDFSGTGRPGQRTAGGSRSQCLNPNFSLTALLPKALAGKTAAERPTFWFHVRDLPISKIAGEFVLQDENRQDVDRIPVQLNDRTELVSFTLPGDRAPLELNRWYRWYLKLYCQPDRTSSPIFVQGWVQRVALDRETKSQLAKTDRPDLIYAQKGIWFDALADLAKLRIDSPENRELQEDWQKLLSAKGVELQLSK
jgi:hypothetical protein